ncbi:MAG: cytochrome c oxidase subunit 3 [Rickettsiales endosymbiont of Dermacentor nuttalli]
MENNGIIKKKHHDFHLVDPSPWPIMASFSLLILACGAVLFMHSYKIGHVLLPIGGILVLFTMFVWWKDLIKEGKEDKAHTEIVRKGLRIGMALFILSEVMFFIAFFASYFKSELFPVAILDGVWAVENANWPPHDIVKIDAWNIPLINTLILLLSGTTVTWAHYALLENNQQDVIKGLLITVLLGIAFSFIQAFEYHHASFKFTDGVFPSNFYMATGFHGVHVIIGTVFLAVCLFRAKRGDFAQGNGYLGFEFAAWYWHFVDVVWLFLFVFVYVWS